MTVGNQAAEQIDQEVERTAMTRVLNLRNILELVNNRFHNGALAQQEFVGEWHQLITHVALEFGDQLNAKGRQQVLKQRLGDVALIGEHFAEQLPDQLRHRFAVIDIAWREREVEQFAALIENQMQFEAKEPADRGFAACGQSCKNFVLLNTAVMANSEAGRVQKRNARA